ncbi:MAG: hypothetical protein J6I96_05150 [Oscillospiraceae bacterium]|nr:hypothetical protein [Oscillospiraceae bacterium]
MKPALSLFFKAELRRLPLYLCLYILPLTVYWQIGMYIDVESRISDALHMPMTTAVLIWTVLVLLFLTVYAWVRIKRLSSDLSRLSPKERDELWSAVKSEGIRLTGGTLTVTPSCIYYTGGEAVPAEEITDIVIERSETGYLDVYHMYIYVMNGKRRTIPLGIGTSMLPSSFEDSIPGRITVTRQTRPLFGRGGIRRTDDTVNVPHK